MSSLLHKFGATIAIVENPPACFAQSNRLNQFQSVMRLLTKEGMQLYLSHCVILLYIAI